MPGGQAVSLRKIVSVKLVIGFGRSPRLAGPSGAETGRRIRRHWPCRKSRQERRAAALLSVFHLRLLLCALAKSALVQNQQSQDRQGKKLGGEKTISSHIPPPEPFALTLSGSGCLASAAWRANRNQKDRSNRQRAAAMSRSRGGGACDVNWSRRFARRLLPVWWPIPFKEMDAVPEKYGQRPQPTRAFRKRKRRRQQQPERYL